MRCHVFNICFLDKDRPLSSIPVVKSLFEEGCVLSDVRGAVRFTCCCSLPVVELHHAGWTVASNLCHIFVDSYWLSIACDSEYSSVTWIIFCKLIFHIEFTQDFVVLLIIIVKLESNPYYGDEDDSLRLVVLLELVWLVFELIDLAKNFLLAWVLN